MKRGFTLVELLVAVAVVAVLAALLLPATIQSGHQSWQVVCMNNLRQINLCVRMYLDDQNNSSPGNTNAVRSPFVSWTAYRSLVGSYAGLKGAPSADDRMFACPADSFYYDLGRNGASYVPQPMHAQAGHAFTSYAYNAGEFSTPPRSNAPPAVKDLGIAGQRLENVPHPARTVLLAEVPAFSPYSWHQPKPPFSRENARFAGAKDVVCFVDGHVSYVKMYYSGQDIAWAYNPPAEYDYQWSGD